MPELKPCPFCGSGAVLQTFTTALEKIPRFRIRCKACWCETDWDSFTPEEAAEKWNGRADCETV